MRRFDEISKAVMTLSPDDRLLLVDWIMERTEAPLGVAEAAPDYGLLTDGSREVSLEEFLEFERSTGLALEFVAGEISVEDSLELKSIELTMSLERVYEGLP